MNRKQRFLLWTIATIYFIVGLIYLTLDMRLENLIMFYLVFGVPASIIYFLLNIVNYVPLNISKSKYEKDPEFDDAVRIVAQHDKVSFSLLQRRLQIGFNKAARLIEQLEAAGVIAPAEGARPRKVLIMDPEEFLNK